MVLSIQLNSILFAFNNRHCQNSPSVMLWKVDKNTEESTEEKDFAFNE